AGFVSDTPWFLRRLDGYREHLYLISYCEQANRMHKIRWLAGSSPASGTIAFQDQGGFSTRSLSWRPSSKLEALQVVSGIF
ncbi:MAG TPA: hypothetical protein VJU59_35370, partial [Paraburkholderia sp.]|uniref:hypothetical protein n=1 Tax=Paraburkholderia sp. TaxID=1926495 RepID=UPI002B499AEA